MQDNAHQARIKQDEENKLAAQAAMQAQAQMHGTERDWENYAAERQQRLARGTQEGGYVRTKG